MLYLKVHSAFYQLSVLYASDRSECHCWVIKSLPLLDETLSPKRVLHRRNPPPSLAEFAASFPSD